MRIVETTADRLALARRPWGVPLICCGMAVAFCAKAVRHDPARTALTWGVLILAIVTCLAMAWLSGDRVSLVFDRVAGSFRWHRQFGLGLRARTGEIPLADVQSALVRAHDSGDGPSWRVELDVTAERIPLVDSYYGSQAENAALAERINQWLHPTAIALQKA